MTTSTVIDKDEEVSGKELLLKLLQKENLSDVRLVGTDGMKISANRCILATKSNVFERMLYGEFEEARSPVVNVGFNGIVLNAVVEYVYTDSAQILEGLSSAPPVMMVSTNSSSQRSMVSSVTEQTGGAAGAGTAVAEEVASKDQSSETSRTTDLVVAGDGAADVAACCQNIDQLKNLIKLHGAATYFNLPGLCKKVEETLSTMLKEHPSVSFVLLEVGNSDPPFPSELKDIAMNEIRINKDIIMMDPKSVAHLSPVVLEDILRDEGHRMLELDLFRILLAWAAGSGLQAASSTATVLDRYGIATELSSYIRLELIDPVQLSELVGPSGLVAQEQLLEAYKTHAITMSKAMGGPRQTARFSIHAPIWKDSKSDVVGSNSDNFCETMLLDYPEITTGIHQWTVQVEKLGHDTWLGVAHTGSSVVLDKKHYLGGQPGGWAYGRTGIVCHDNRCFGRLQSFSEGSMITFTLNLLGNGTLRAAVDDGTPLTLFSNLRSQLVGNCSTTSGGFVPAASMFSPGIVRILSIQKLQGRVTTDNDSADMPLGNDSLEDIPFDLNGSFQSAGSNEQGSHDNT